MPAEASELQPSANAIEQKPPCILKFEFMSPATARDFNTRFGFKAENGEFCFMISFKEDQLFSKPDQVIRYLDLWVHSWRSIRLQWNRPGVKTTDMTKARS